MPAGSPSLRSRFPDLPAVQTWGARLYEIRKRNLSLHNFFSEFMTSFEIAVSEQPSQGRKRCVLRFPCGCNDRQDAREIDERSFVRV
jgi:hypothetical protein